MVICYSFKVEEAPKFWCEWCKKHFSTKHSDLSAIKMQWRSIKDSQKWSKTHKEEAQKQSKEKLK